MANILAYSLCRLENLHISMECCVQFMHSTVYSACVLSSHEHAVCFHGWNLLFLSGLQHYEMFCMNHPTYLNTPAAPGRAVGSTLG